MPARVLTQHNNNQRTGANIEESTLSPVLVRTSFGRRLVIPVDPPAAGGPSNWASQIVAQPLVVSGVTWSDGSSKDVLVAATMHGTVYAFDINSNYAQLWAVWLGQPVLDLPGFDKKDIYGTNPEWGILSTPVIDAALKRIYVVMWNGELGGTYRLHSLDLLSGGDTRPPGIVQGSFLTVNGHITFNPVFQKQRPGLLLLRPSDLPPDRATDVGPDGTLYIGFGASIEEGDYHGWVFAFDARTLARQAVWCASGRGSGAGIWQAGQGLTADDQGNIYLMTGNGDFDGRDNFGESFVKLSCKDLAVLDFFTPWNWADLNNGDRDLGSSGPVFLHGGPFVVGGGKVGRLYSLSADHLGGAGDAVTQTNPSIDEIQATNDPPIRAVHPPGPGQDHDHHIHGSPVFFEPLSRLYLWGENDVLRGIAINPDGHFSRTPVVGEVVAPSGMPGGMLSISAASDGSNAIVWAVVPLAGDANKQRLVDGVLRAFDAVTLEEIWNSNTVDNQLGHFAKFSPPTVANGRVYVPTYDGKLVVYSGP